MCDKVDKYKTQEMWDKAVGFNLITLKFVSDWFVTKKMLEKIDDYLFSNDDIFFHDIFSWCRLYYYYISYWWYGF